MASLRFPDTGTRMVVLPTGKPAATALGFLYADEDLITAAEAYTDVDGVKGTLIPLDDDGRTPLTLDGYGEQPDYWGPADGARRLWLAVNGVVSPVDADYKAQIESLSVAVGDALDTAAQDATAKSAAAQAFAVQRANHTGTQAQSTVTNLTADLAAKVVKGALVLDIRDYGALVNGSTDDTAAVQAAIAASTPGARIFYPPGTCIISATLLPKTGTTHFGVRGKSVVKAKTGVTGFNIFQPTGVNNVAFEDLVIDLNKAGTTNPGTNTAGVGVYIAVTTGGTGFVLRRVEVMNGWQVGLRFLGHTGQTDPASLNPSEAVFDDCNVHDCSGQGIMAVNTTRLRLRNCTTSGNGLDGVFHSTSRNTVITGCTAEGNGGHGIVATYVEGLKVTDCNAQSNTLWGIAVGGGSTTIQPNKRCVISGNTCSANGTGGITNDPTVTGAPGVPVDIATVVAGNVCFNNLVDHGIYLHNTKNAVVAGNICFGNANSGIAVHGLYAAVSGNLCYGNTLYGISIQGDGTETVPYGNHRLTGNSVYGNTSAQVFITASTTNVGIVDPSTIKMETGSTVGFYGSTPITKQTGVPVDAAGIHAALVALGLIGA